MSAPSRNVLEGALAVLARLIACTLILRIVRVALWSGAAVLVAVALVGPTGGDLAAAAQRTATLKEFESIGVAKAPYGRYRHQAGMARDGTAVVSWLGGRRTVARSLSASGTPSELQTIEPFTGPYWRAGSQMAVGASGDSVFIGGLNSSITFVRTRSFDGSLGTTLSLAAPGPLEFGTSDQAAAVDDTGRALVVKSRGRCCSVDSLASVIAYRVAPSGMLLATIPLFERRTDYPDDSLYALVYDVGMDRNGNAVVLWELNTGNPGQQAQLFVQRITADGRADAPIEVARGSRDPQFAVAVDWWVTVIWRTGQRGIHARMVSPEGVVTPRWTLSRRGGDVVSGLGVGLASLAPLDGGATVVSWSEWQGRRRSWIVSTVLRPDGAGALSVLSGPARLVNRELGSPAVGRRAALVVWTEVTGVPGTHDVGYSVWARLVRSGGDAGRLTMLASPAREGCRGVRAAGNGRGRAIVVCMKPVASGGRRAQVLVKALRIP